MPHVRRIKGMHTQLQELADLIRARNAVARQITTITGRPASLGHLGEYIAGAVFDVALEASASNRGHDGQFRSGPLQGQTVNVKWYSRQQGLLDMRADAVPDQYLVLTGPAAPPSSSRGKDQPWAIDSVFLFDARQLVEVLLERGTKVGIATSVRRDAWRRAEVYPAVSDAMPLSEEQRVALRTFHSSNMSV